MWSVYDVGEGHVLEHEEDLGEGAGVGKGGECEGVEEGVFFGEEWCFGGELGS